MVPRLKAVHWEPGDGPTECVALLTQSFRAAGLARAVPHPVVHRVVPRLRHAARVRLPPALAPGAPVPRARAGGRSRRRVTSSRSTRCSATYPDARVVVLHRDPVRTVASSASLSVTSRPDSLSSADFDGYYGPMWVDVLGTMVDRLVEYRDRDRRRAGSSTCTTASSSPIRSVRSAGSTRTSARPSAPERRPDAGAPGRAPQRSARRAHATPSPTSACDETDGPRPLRRVLRTLRRRGRSRERIGSRALAFVGCGAIAEWHLHAIQRRRHAHRRHRGDRPRPRPRAGDGGQGRRRHQTVRFPGRRRGGRRLRRRRRDGARTTCTSPSRSKRSTRGCTCCSRSRWRRRSTPATGSLPPRPAAGTVFMVAENAQYWPEVVLAQRLVRRRCARGDHHRAGVQLRTTARRVLRR